MYLIILEDGSIYKKAVIDSGDLTACNNGYCSIIDINNPNMPKEYYNGWTEVETYNSIT